MEHVTQQIHSPLDWKARDARGTWSHNSLWGPFPNDLNTSCKALSLTGLSHLLWRASILLLDLQTTLKKPARAGCVGQLSLLPWFFFFRSNSLSPSTRSQSYHRSVDLGYSLSRYMNPSVPVITFPGPQFLAQLIGQVWLSYHRRPMSKV